MIKTNPFNPLIPDATRMRLFKLETPRREIAYSKTPMQEQQEFCRKNDYPCFAFDPCPSCKKSPWDHPEYIRTAGSRLVTGCPWCCRSWCD